MTEFVEGWLYVQALGEGSYGEVRLLVNKNTGSAVAAKVIDIDKHPTALSSIQKEVVIHSKLSHENIIKYYGKRKENNLVYIFMEYASGGELFDRIEPDVGVPEAEARRYFLELISGVEYIHSLGVVHRDLKPENILLDGRGRLKICDFGMATFFRINDRVRKLETRCGTTQYVAPEVLKQNYDAEPVDIWSCGIILIALLTGELPWNEPSSQSEDYVTWTSNHDYINYAPWSKINAGALSLLRKILISPVDLRYNLEQIKSHAWSRCTNDLYMSPSSCTDIKYSYSQPSGDFTRSGNPPQHDATLLCFSQPTQINDLLLSTQLLSSQLTSNMDCWQKLVKRMTRFFVSTNVEVSMERLINVVEKLGYTWKPHCAAIITIHTFVRSKVPLSFRASIIRLNNDTLMEFRLSRGCGIEFKKCFITIKREFSDIIVKREII